MSALSEIEQGRTVRYDNCPVAFTKHAVAAINRRVYRTLDLERAEHQLYRDAARSGLVQPEPPPWLHWHRGKEWRWLVIEDIGAAFPIKPRTNDVVGMTALTPIDPVGASVHWESGPGVPFSEHGGDYDDDHPSPRQLARLDGNRGDCRGWCRRPCPWLSRGVALR